MISHGKDLKVFTGNANPALAQEIVLPLRSAMVTMVLLKVELM